jgi:predicted MFS family arabinose efflux permease
LRDRQPRTFTGEAKAERPWHRTLAVLAVTASLAVSVIYLPQAMLTEMAVGLAVTPGAAGVIATAVQAGYAIGIFLFVPLADRVHPRRHITVQTIALAAAYCLLPRQCGP